MYHKSKFTIFGGHNTKFSDDLETENNLNENGLLEKTISEMNEHSLIHEQNLMRNLQQENIN